MKNRSQDPLQKARNAALSLLARRQHSREEVRHKLTARGFDQQVVEKVLFDCERLHYIDDETAADLYLAELIRKRFGLFKIKEAMISRGFDQHLIGSMIEKHQLLNSEPEIAAAAAEKKIATLQRETDHRKRKMKLIRFLQSRGFSPSAISAALEEIGNS